MDLVERLRAELDRLESLAKRCGATDWRIPTEGVVVDRDVDGWSSVPDHSRIFSYFDDREDEAVHAVNHDPDAVLPQIDGAREILGEHEPRWENVEWPHAADGSGKNWVCSNCRPAEPTEWHPAAGEAGVLSEGFVPSYVLAPCPTLRALAKMYRIEVEA